MGGVEGHAGEAGYMIFFGLGAQGGLLTLRRVWNGLYCTEGPSVVSSSYFLACIIFPWSKVANSQSGQASASNPSCTCRR